MSGFLNRWADLPPPGAVGPPQRDYWKVGDGLPASGGQIGYDLRWLDAEANVIGERTVQADPKTPITEAEYDTLLLAWENQ